VGRLIFRREHDGGRALTDRTNYGQKAIQAAQSIRRTSFTSWWIAFKACRVAANQKWSELSGLVHLVRGLSPISIIEIGVDGGGTMALWAQIAATDARLIGVDLEISAAVQSSVRASLRTGQALSLFAGDSHSDATKRRVRDTLGDNKVDFLFIDGDHGYEGVKQDFEDYGPLVRKGGLVAFHDIVPDFSTRFGIHTGQHSGAVHKFWREVSTRYPHDEFIESIAQDGFGIGVIYV